MAAGTGRSVFKIQNVRPNRKWCKTFLKIAIDIDFDLRMKTKEIRKVFETLKRVSYKIYIKKGNFLTTGTYHVETGSFEL